MERASNEFVTFTDRNGTVFTGLNIMTFGSHRAGKTSLVNTFVGNSHVHYYPTIGSEYKTKIVRIDDCDVKLHVFDLAAGKAVSERPPPQPMVRNSHAVLLVFDITSLESFEFLKLHAHSLRGGQLTIEHNFYADIEELPCIVVAAKCDLCADRQVPRSVAQEFAKEMDLIYLESSAETGDNVEQVYITATALALNQCKSKQQYNAV